MKQKLHEKIFWNLLPQHLVQWRFKSRQDEYLFYQIDDWQ